MPSAMNGHAGGKGGSSSTGITVNDRSFALNGANVSYHFHVGDDGDLITDHFGGSITELPVVPVPRVDGWTPPQGRSRREYPDTGRSDPRLPAIHIRHAQGHTVTKFAYQSHEIKGTKPALEGLPSTFGKEGEVETLIIHLSDTVAKIDLELAYSIFPKLDVITRSAVITNRGQEDAVLEKAASLSVDLPYTDLDMINLRGDWAREAQKQRKRVDYGVQSFGSTTGYSSHLHNPFLALCDPKTTESHGDAWAFNLVYTGSFNIEVEKGSQGYTRAVVGVHPLHLSWKLSPGESFTTPECISAYSNQGIGGVSRRLHSLYRHNLMKSKFAIQDRPVLLNSWEGVYFDLDDKIVFEMARHTADLGIKLFVLDDGWFGNKYPRNDDHAGLGDWETNKAKFPNGLSSIINKITELDVKHSQGGEKLRFGLWVEPEMVNPKSVLYESHPDWVLHVDGYERTEQRNQLVLNLALTEVQDYIIKSLSDILDASPIKYIKWDNNRAIHEMASPSTMHSYMLGLYRVLSTLTTRHPDVLWEGCASGGGRFDAGIMQYFPQSWTSDCTDALDRITIQFGTSLAYPPSSMGCHVATCPNHQTGRTTPFTFRAHVAMMGGSFGFELDPKHLSEEEKAVIPGIIALAEKINPIVIRGDQYRLQLPEESNWPASMSISEDGSKAVVFYFQMKSQFNHNLPPLKLQGLDPEARYTVNGEQTLSGKTLMNVGLQYWFKGDYGSTIFLLERV